MNESIKRLHKSRFFRAIFRSFLFGEQEFPILGQRPYFVVYLHLQMVDMIADFIEVRTHFFFVFECPLFVVIFVIGYFSGFGHFAYQYFDGSHPVRDFTNPSMKETFGYKTPEAWFAYLRQWKEELAHPVTVKIKDICITK